MQRQLLTLSAALLILGVTGCGEGGGGSGTTTAPPPISQTELGAIDKAHADFHALVYGQFAPAIKRCATLGCYSGVAGQMQAEIETLDTVLQHGEETATGGCKVAIQTAQADLAGVRQSFAELKAALDSGNIGSVNSSSTSITAFNADLNRLDGACASGAAPNA